MSLLGLSAFLMVLTAAPLAAEEGEMRLTVEARRVGPAPNDAEQLHWVLLGVPEIKLATARGQADVSRRLADAIKMTKTANCKVHVVGVRSSCNLLFRIEDDTLQIHLGDFENPPTAEAPARSVTIKFDYTETPPAIIQSLTIDVWTDSVQRLVEAANSTVPGSEGPPHISVIVSYGEAVRRLQRTPLPGLDSVNIHLHYLEADRSRGSEEEGFSQERVENALLEVAILALDPVHAEGLVPGKQTPDDDTVLQNVDDRISGLLQSGIRNWPALVGTVQYASEARMAVNLVIRGARIVAFARISVERGQIESEKGELVSFRGADARLERDIREDLQRAEETLAETFRRDLEELEGTVPTQAKVQAIRDSLRKRVELRGFPRVEAFGGNLVYKGTRSWVVGKVDGKIKASLSPEDFLVGEGTLTAENLLRNWWNRDFGESYSYSLRGGSELQDTEFVLGFPRTRGERWTANYGVDITALYYRDTKQMLGTFPGASDRELTEREKGIKPRAYLELRKISGSKSPWTSFTRIDAIFDRRNLLLRQNWDKVDLTNGQLAAPTLRLRQGFGYVPEAKVEEGKGRGLGNIMFEFNAEGRKGIRSLGGDFAFRQYLVAGRVESFFGFRSRRDFLVRYRRGFGASSTGTPLYQFFRLGGTGSLRGIEEGEFFGKGIGFAQADAAVNAEFLWRTIRRPKPSAPASNPDKPAPQPPISLEQIYIGVFYDRADVSNSPHVKDLLKLQSPSWGRGIAVELRRLNKANISIGYAQSPQSILHRKGLMTIGVSFDFY